MNCLSTLNSTSCRHVAGGYENYQAVRLCYHFSKGWVYWHENSNTTRASKPVSYAELVKRTGIEFLSGVVQMMENSRSTFNLTASRLALATNSLFKMKKLVLLLFLVVTFTSSQAQKMMLGPPDCGEWFQQPSSKAWLAGYLSGINGSSFYSDGTDFIEAVSGAQVFLWMDNYCKANPLKTVPEGANQLIRELYTKANKKS